MIFRTIEEINGSQREVRAPNGNWVSQRFLLAEDGMGFSFHITKIYAGTETHIWYQHHLESVYCIRGVGEVEVIPNGEVYPLRPGVMYALNGHEDHYLRASEDLELACVFNPALSGRETHLPDGSYPPPT